MQKQYSPIQILYAKRYAEEYRKRHKEEYYSLSPYAPTSKTPTMRIVDNAIITGSGYTDEITSTDHYGFFGGYQGSSQSGGGGSWEINTEVQFDRIYLCPVTGQEFLASDLKEYRNIQFEKLREWSLAQVDKLRIREDFGVDGWTVITPDGKEKLHYKRQTYEALGKEY